jgi:hypothetical protein
MRTFNYNFIRHMVNEAETQEKEMGPMSKTYYHRFYLAQECARRLDEYREFVGHNKQWAVRKLVKAATSAMGEFSKITGWNGSDINPEYLSAVKDECDLLDATTSVWMTNRGLVDGSIARLLEYCQMRDKDKRKQEKRLIQISAFIIAEYNRIIR